LDVFVCYVFAVKRLKLKQI